MASPKLKYPHIIGADEHDLGLAHDLETFRIFNRRRALGMFGMAGTAVLLSGCGDGDTTTATPTPTPSATATPTPTPTATATPTPTPSATATPDSCALFATETNGPYPADGTNQSSGSTSNVLTNSVFERSDIRSSVLGTSTVADGVEARIALTLADVNDSCTPLAGYVVYMWHCDATGQYSLYDLPTETYLRGYQVADENGVVEFTTIFPGCYAGRYPHIHFEVFSSLDNATSGRFAVLISQLAMPSAACTTVYADSRYGQSLSRFKQTSIASDNVFGDNSAAVQAAMTLEMTGSNANGFDASVVVGVAT